MSEELSPFCPRYKMASEIVGRRWTGAILRALLCGQTRFNDIGKLIPGLSDRLLSERLKELEMEGLVVRAVTPSTPVRITYNLTAKGRALLPVLMALAEWAEEWLPAEDQTPAGTRERPAKSGAKKRPV